MHGQNFLFNQPLAIDSNFLLSLVANLISGYQQNNFLSAAQILETAEKKIVAQSTFATSKGADQFPVVLDIIGPILKYSSWYYLGTQDIISIVKKLDAHPQVSGIVFNIDSGGGMVSGTAELTDAIKNLQKPTIAFTAGYMCSAALKIASGANYRMASPHADFIGSVGTMLQYQDFSKMFEKWGAVIEDLYAPQSTEKNKESRAFSAGDKKAYDEMLSEIAGNFIDTVKENLKNTLKDDGHVLKGKIYNPEGALSVGLINEIGTLEDALAKF